MKNVTANLPEIYSVQECPRCGAQLERQQSSYPFYPSIRYDMQTKKMRVICWKCAYDWLEEPYKKHE